MRSQQPINLDLASRRLRFRAAIIDAFASVFPYLIFFLVVFVYYGIIQKPIFIQDYIFIFPLLFLLIFILFLLYLGQPLFLLFLLIVPRVLSRFFLFPVFLGVSLPQVEPMNPGTRTIPSSSASSSLDILGFIGSLLLVSELILIVIQILLLLRVGQTIGKKLANIKIVRLDSRRNGGFVANVLIRYLANGLICFLFSLNISTTISRFISDSFLYSDFILFLASLLLYELIDILFILRPDKRCFHDILAGTCVVTNR